MHNARGLEPEEAEEDMGSELDVCAVCAKPEVCFGTTVCRECATFFAANIGDYKEYKALATGCANVYVVWFIEKCLKAGVRLPAEHAPVTDTLFTSCKVCDARAPNVLRYGVISCDRCFNLFKDFEEKSQEVVCIHRYNRNGRRCGSCRLRRCVRMGMCKDAAEGYEAKEYDSDLFLACKVCWRPVYGNKFNGIPCCEYCETFFKNYSDKLELLCCDGHKYAKDSCLKCLLVLCFQSGLRFDNSNMHIFSLPCEYISPFTIWPDVPELIESLDHQDVIVYCSSVMPSMGKDEPLDPSAVASLYNGVDVRRKLKLQTLLTLIGKYHIASQLPNPIAFNADVDDQTPVYQPFPDLFLIPSGIFSKRDESAIMDKRAFDRWFSITYNFDYYMDIILDSELMAGTYEKDWLSNEVYGFLEPVDEMSFANTAGPNAPMLPFVMMPPGVGPVQLPPFGAAQTLPPLPFAVFGLPVLTNSIEPGPDGSHQPTIDFQIIAADTVSAEEREELCVKRHNARKKALAEDSVELYVDFCFENELAAGYCKSWWTTEAYLSEFLDMIHNRHTPDDPYPMVGYPWIDDEPSFHVPTDMNGTVVSTEDMEDTPSAGVVDAPSMEVKQSPPPESVTPKDE